MTPGEARAYRAGFLKAKGDCIKIVDEWSRACHPVHPKKAQELGSKSKCWQHHGLQSAKASIERDVRPDQGKRPFSIKSESIDVGSYAVMDMDIAVNEHGHFIGTPEEAENLFLKFGITKFELRTKKSSVCTVGYSPKKKLWYGWSHRAIKGFKTRDAAAKFADSVS